MIGMLVGIAALSAWGLYRFNQHLQSLPPSQGADNTLAGRLAAEAARYREAYVLQYGEIFGITAIVCVVGALLGLLISGRSEHADEPVSIRSQPDDSPTQVIDAPTRAFDAPTQAISAQRADQTVRIQRQPPGPQRPR